MDIINADEGLYSLSKGELAAISKNFKVLSSKQTHKRTSRFMSLDLFEVKLTNKDGTVPSITKVEQIAKTGLTFPPIPNNKK